MKVIPFGVWVYLAAGPREGQKKKLWEISRMQ
jgi:hypothetical protein